MSNLVTMADKQAVTSTTSVAENFEREHHNVLKAVESLKKDVVNFNEMFYHAKEQDSYSRDRKVYLMNRDGFTLLAMGFTGKKAMQFKLKYIEAFNQMEKHTKREEQTTPLKENFEMQLIGVDYAPRILRVDETSKIKMLEDAHKQHHVPTNHLPEYVDEEGTKSMTELLKEHEVGIGPVRMNNKLVEVGLLETVERPSSKGKIKTYRSITQHGLKYGKNLINQRNPRETQAHWYPSKFNDLLKEAGV